jgi:glycosyltransferase involved in cell wall biosynthesis
MIEFIIPTHNSPDKLRVILQSLIVQTIPEWTAHVIIDGITNIYFDVKDYYQKYPNIRFSHIDGPNNDWGHSARNYGLGEIQSPYVVMTGDDNYYVPTFVEEMLNHSGTINMVICNMVHNNVNGGYQPVDSIVRKVHIDIGNVMYKSSCIGDLRLDKTDYDADFTFIQEFIKRNVKSYNDIHKIPKYLYVHN